MTESSTVTAIAPQESREVAPAITPPQMLAMAVEQGADLDKLGKLMDLQDRWEANEARKAYVAALSAFKANPPTVIKNKKADYGKGGTAYKYADLAQVVNVIAPALSEHGLTHRWAPSQSEAGIEITCFLTHERGHTEQASMRAPADTSGSKNSIQAIASTVSYLERYTLLAITGLAVADQDDDGHRAVDQKMLTAEHKQQIIAILERHEPKVTTRLLKALAVSDLDILPDARFNDAMGLLKKLPVPKGEKS